MGQVFDKLQGLVFISSLFIIIYLFIYFIIVLNISTTTITINDDFTQNDRILYVYMDETR